MCLNDHIYTQIYFEIFFETEAQPCVHTQTIRHDARPRRTHEHAQTELGTMPGLYHAN